MLLDTHTHTHTHTGRVSMGVEDVGGEGAVQLGARGLAVEGRVGDGDGGVLR